MRVKSLKGRKATEVGREALAGRVAPGPLSILNSFPTILSLQPLGKGGEEDGRRFDRDAYLNYFSSWSSAPEVPDPRHYETPKEQARWARPRQGPCLPRSQAVFF